MTRRDLALETATPMLVRLGFEKKRRAVFTLVLSQGVLGWLGLNRATQHMPIGAVAINPVVGVQHLGIEHLVRDLRGMSAKAYVPPTLATPLGYAMPENKYREWVFSAETAESVGIDMVDAISKHGLPWMRSLTELPAICRALEPPSKLAGEDDAMYRRPVAWLLAGNAARASSELDKSLASLRARTDPAARAFREFTANLRAFLSDSDRT